jgi:AraC-like DNA-binding protein
VTAALSALFPQAALLVRQVDDGDALLSAGEPATVVLVPPRDLEGRSTTGAIEALAARSQRPLLLGYVPIGRGTSPDILQLGRTSIDGLVLSHVNDGGNALRATLLAAVLRRVGADLDEALRGAFPEEALRLARLGMRSDPVATIDEGALVIRTSRRTIHKRLRARRLPAARELLEWGRLILATALLERMRWSTLEVAGILRFSSPGALRASCRRRLGRSVRTLREPGATDQVLQAFQAVADRSGRTPQARSASRPTDPR